MENNIYIEGYKIPTDSLTGNSKVIRGGSWNDIPLFIRNKTRFYEYPSAKNNKIGFRVIKK